MDPRPHAPLRRTSGTLLSSSSSSSTPGCSRQLRKPHLLPNVVMPNDADSCYSSCDDISHPSLSRECSDTLSNETRQPSKDMISFATKLGYTIDQLSEALNRVGFDAKIDQVLSELVKNQAIGTQTTVSCEASSTSSNSSNDLRSIVIDGSNVAMAYGRKEVFSCAGIRDCVRYFYDRGHRDILVFIPQFRKEQPRSDCPITDQHILQELDEQKFICWTPSRNVNGRRVVCHDDRYILKTAEEKDAVIVSNDEYRDLTKENPLYRRLVEQRQLMFTIIDDKFVPPDDPMGRFGPRLDVFLSKSTPMAGTQLCPYARKCTYGNKCKYFHPERANGSHMSVTERLIKENQQKKALSTRNSLQSDGGKQHLVLGRTQSLNVNYECAPEENKQPKKITQRTHQQLQHVSSAPWRHPMIAKNSSGMNTSSISNHLYAPSTDVWGCSELSVGPVSTKNQSDEHESDARARVKYHLSNLFPAAVVEAVMTAHPEETNAQILCEKILRMGQGFK